MLDLIQGALIHQDIRFQRIDGQTSLVNRIKALSEFDANPDCSVLLASIGSLREGCVDPHSLQRT